MSTTKITVEATLTMPLLLDHANHFGDWKARLGRYWNRLLNPVACRVPESQTVLVSQG